MKKLLRNATLLLALFGLVVSAHAQSCDPITITATNSLSENFDSYTSVASTAVGSVGTVLLPSCWNAIYGGSSNGYRPHLYKGSTYNAGGSTCIAITSGSSSSYGSNNYIALPGVTNSLSELELKFDVQMENASYGTLYVGYMTDPTDVSTFTSISTISNNAGSRSPKTVDLSNVSTTGTVYVAFKWSCSSSYYSCTIDNVVLKKTDDCPANFSNLAISEFEAYTVGNNTKFRCDFSWTDATSAGSYKYICVPAGTTPNWSSNAVSVTPATSGNEVAPLEPNTTYDLYVMVNCTTGSGVTTPAGPLTFTTPCLPMNLPLSENFESMDASTSIYTYNGTFSDTYKPSCWTVIDNAYTYYSSNYDCTPHVYSNSGNKCLVLPAGASSIGGIAVLPNVIGDLEDMQIIFKDRRYSASYGTLYLGYYANNTFTTLTTVTSGATSWVDREYTFSAFAAAANAPAGARIAFKFSYTSNTTSYYALIDDIIVRLAPDCASPTNLSVSNVNSSSATLSWTGSASGTAWEVVYGTPGFDPDNAVAQTVNAQTLSISNLSSDAAYEFYVREACQGTTYWAGPYAFRTACEAASVPWTEGFESTTFPPSSCWQNNHITGSGANVWARTTSQKHAGTAAAYVADQSAGTKTELVTPLLNIPTANSYQISFWMYRANDNYPKDNEGVKLLVNTSPTSTNATSLLFVERFYNRGQIVESASGWYQYTATIPNSGELYVIFEATNQYGGALYIDDIAIEEIPSCEKPTAVSVDNVTATNATVAWTAGGTETSWMVKWTNLAYADSAIVTTNPYTITNLAPQSNYSVIVKAICGANDQSVYTDAIAFTTPCMAINNLPWVEDFESYAAAADETDATLPSTCWNKLGNPDFEPGVYSDNTTNLMPQGNNALALYSNDYSTPSMVILPPFERALTDLQVDFLYKSEAGSGGVMHVGYITDAANASSFTSLATISESSTTVSKTYVLRDFSDSIPANARLAFRFNCYTDYDYETYDDIYFAACIDSIAISLAPPCARPTQVTANNIGTTSATIHWRRHTNDTQWEVACVPTGTQPTTGTVTSVDSLVLSNLTPATTYDVYVKATCGEDVTEWSDVVSFTTECEIIVLTNSNLFFEEFEGITAGIPTCWDNSDGTTTTESYKWNSYSSGHNGRGMRFDSYLNTRGKTNMLKTPVLDLSNLTGATLSFWWQNGGSGDMSVYISTNGGATYTTSLATSLKNNSSWSQKVIDLTNYCGQGYDNVVIVFKNTSDYGSYYHYLDEVKVEPVLPCVKPTNLATSEISDNSVKLTWTAGGSETSWNVRYFTAQGDTTVVSVTTNPYTVTRLADNTTYTFAVQADCGGNDGLSHYSESVSATTECAPRSLPYTDNFNYSDGRSISSSTYSSADMADCWKYIYSGTNASYKPHLYYGTYSPTANDTCLLVTSSTYSSYGNRNTLIFPRVNADLQDLYVSFDYTQSNSTASDAYLQFGYITDITDTASFVALQTLPHVYYSSTPRSKFFECFVSDFLSQSVTNANLAVRFVASTSSTYYVTIDNVSVEIAPSCRKPSNIVATQITSNSATLTWNAQGNETGYLVSYQAAGGQPQDVMPTTNTVTLTGLNGNTTYTVEIMAACDNDQSIVSTAYSFTTDCDPYVLTPNEPFVQDFDALTEGIPDCWHNDEGTTTTSSYKWNYNSSGHEGNCVMFNSYTNSSGNTNILKSQAIDMTQAVDGAELSFWVKYPNTSTDPAKGRLDVYLYAGNDTVQLATNIRRISSWTKFTYDISNYAGVNSGLVNIVFKGTSDYGSYNLYLDDVKVKAFLPCHTPTNVVVSSISDDEINFTWDVVENAISYTVQYSNTIDVAGQGTTATTQINNYSFTNLTPDSTLYIYVQADCGDTDGISEWTEVAVSGQTASCSAITITETTPYSEDFNGLTAGTSTTNSATAGFPTCWSRVYDVLSTSYDYTPHVYMGSYAPIASDNALMLAASTSYGNPAVVALPQFTNNTEDLLLSFTTAMSSSNNQYCQLEVGYMANPYDKNSFVSLSTIPNNYYYNNDTRRADHQIYIRDYADVPAGSFIAFRWSSTSSTTYYCAIDNIEVSIAPTCVAPNAITISNITSSSVEINWNARNGETSWYYEYGFAGYNPEEVGAAIEGFFINVNELPLTIENLTDNTEYDFYLKSNCGNDQSERSEVVTFRTTCIDLTITETSNFYEDFEDYAGNGYGANATLPSCWNYTGVANYTPGVYNGTSYCRPRSGSKALAMYPSTADSGSIVILPGFTNDLRELQVDFIYQMESDNSSQRLYAGYITDINDASSFVALKSFPINKTSYKHDNVIMKAYASQLPEHAYLAFRYYWGTSSTYVACIDSVVVSLAPACVAPTNLTVNNITDSSAHVSWTPQDFETQWEVACVVSGQNVSEGTIVSHDTATINGLTDATVYDVYVRAICSPTDESEWFGPVTFTTECRPLSLPYSENFENYRSSSQAYSSVLDTVARWTLPTCWDEISTPYEGYSYDYYYSAHVYANTSSNYYVPSGSSKVLIMGQGPNNYALLPKFADLSNAQILFKTAMYSEYYGILSLGYMLNGRYTTLVTVPSNEVADGFEQHEYNLNTYNIPAGARLAFKYYYDYDYNYNYTCAIDDIIVREIPTCNAPNDVVIANITETSANVTWTPFDDEQVWNIQYGPAGFELGQGTIVTVTDTTNSQSLALSGLNPSTLYEVYIQSDCGNNDISYWSNPIRFRTSCGIYTITAEEPFTDGFEDYEAAGYADDNIMPACWNYTGEANNTPGVYNGTYYCAPTSGSNALVMYSHGSDGNGSIVILPEFTNALSSLQISFTYRMESSNNTQTLSLGYITDINDESTFAALESFPAQSSSYLLKSISLNQYAAQLPTQGRLAFKYSYANTTNYIACIDDVVVELGPDCATPTGVTASSISTNSATITWNSGDTTAWIVACHIQGDTAVTTVEVTDTTYMLQNLAANTTYVVNITAACAGVTYPSQDLYFTTACDAYTITVDAPFTEGFENYTAANYGENKTMPSCWNYTGVANYTPGVYTSTSWCAPTSGSNALGLHSVGSTGDGSIVILPEFTNALSSLQISFTYQIESSTTNQSFSFGYITDINDESTFAELQGIEIHTGNYLQTTISLDQYAAQLPAQGRLAFKYHYANTTNYIACIDDVVVTLLPDCESPVDIATTVVTGNTATITWDGGEETAWTVAYHVEGDTAISTVEVTEPTATLQNLSSRTNYVVNITAVCDGITFPSENFYFSTSCEAYTITHNAPYTEDFSAYTASTSYSNTGVMPDCWEKIFVGTSNSYAPHVFKNTSYSPTTNNNALSMVAAKNSTYYGQESYVVLPEFTNPLGDLKIEFATSMSTADGQLSIGFIMDPNDPDSYSNWENISTNLNSSSATRYASHTIYVYDYLADYDMPAGSRIAFKWENTQSTSISVLGLDDIVVSLYQLYDTTAVTACDSYTDSTGVVYTETTSSITTDADDDYIYNHVYYVEINHSVYDTISETACDSLVWENTTIYTTGQYVQRLQTAAGCDSIIVMNATINNSVATSFADSACLTYTWNNETYTESGDYVQQFQTVAGCDSIVTLHLNILHGTYEAMSDQTCDTAYTWNWHNEDIVYTTSGTYTRYAEGANGCQDTAVLNLTFYTPITTNLTAQICDGETYSLYNFNVSEAGTYTQTGLQTVHGCDSTVILTLTVGDRAETHLTAVICEGDDYTENGFSIMQPVPGVITDSLTITRQGSCDSVVYVTLTVNPKTYGTDVVEACNAYTWMDGVTYRQSTNTPTWTITNANGCDSIITLDLTIYNSITTDDYQTACESYTWNNNVYTETGNYLDTLTTVHGCDSIVTLHLTINHNTYATDVQSACNSYTWIDGNTYTQSTNNVTYVMTNAAGCDSIITLDLTIHTSAIGRDSITTCGSYTWIDGITYTESTYGQHIYLLTSAAGCDSTSILYLTVNPAYYDTTHVEACDSYTWTEGDGRTYRSSRVITYAMTTAAGCDSIKVLDLVINYTETAIDVVEACDSFTWIDGVTYTQSTDSATWTLTSSHGCDSIVTLNLTIFTPTNRVVNESACGSYTWAETGETYTESGDYPMTYTSSHGCDSTITLHLVVYEMPVIEITGETEITAGESTTLAVTEGDGWNYAWSTGERTPEITVTPTATTTYTVIVSNGSCIANENVTVTVSVGVADYDVTIDRIYPNPADEYCTVEAANMQMIYVFNMNGQKVSTFNVDNVNSYRIETATLAPGVYFVKVITTDNKVMTAKFVVKH